MDVDKLLDALDDVIEAKAKYREAEKECPYDWGYYGFPYRESLERAKATFSDNLKELIKETVQEILDEQRNNPNSLRDRDEG